MLAAFWGAVTQTEPGGTARCSPEMTSPFRPSAITEVTVTVGTGWRIIQPCPVQPVWPPFPTRPTLFVSLVLWACLPRKEGSEGRARVPTASAFHRHPWAHAARGPGFESSSAPLELHHPKQLIASFSCLVSSSVKREWY